jgi:Na/Pi-cotransporter
MSYEQILQALTGLGLLLFALRYLNNALEDSLNLILRPWLNRALSRPLNCLLVGFGLTTLVQASSITILTSMGLLNAFVISLEQGYLLILGASLGTTLKAWLFTRLLQIHGGSVLVGICSIALLFVHHKRTREYLQMAMAIGFAFLGLQILATSLGQIVSARSFLDYFSNQEALGISGEALAILVGLLLTMMVQSSSTVVFVLLQLASQGSLGFAAGTALILGANLGTSFQPLLASIEYGKNVRRLAFSYFLVKAGGVLITLLFFSLFLRGVDRLIPGFPAGENLVYHLAGSHFLFNLISVAAAYFLMPFILRLLFLVIPGPSGTQDFFLYPVVRRMLRQSPDKTLFEVEEQMQTLLRLTMAEADQVLQILFDAKEHQVLKSEKEGHFRLLREGLYELLIPLSRKTTKKQVTQKINHHLAQLQASNLLYQKATVYLESLREGLSLNGYKLPGEIRDLIPDLQNAYHNVWLHFFNQKTAESDYLEMDKICNRLEERYQTIHFDHHTEAAYYAWLHHLLADLRQLVLLTEALLTQNIASNTKEIESP